MTGHDVVVVGGGHNGLVCAAYLAAAGLDVVVLERRAIAGGAATTEEFHPGFRNSVASYTVSLLHPKIIRELNLAAHGLEIITRPFSNSLPLPDGRVLRTGPDLTSTQAEFARFSATDAERLPAYHERIDAVGGVLRSLLLETPPNLGGGLREMLRAAGVGRRLGGLPRQLARDTLDLFTKSAGDLLDRWFETDAIKALFGFDAVVGNYSSPYAPGSGYVLLHHVIGEVNGRRGQWGHARGGMGAVTSAMMDEALRRGVVVHTNAPVARVNVVAGRATGVTLSDGRVVNARAVASNLNPKLLFTTLVDGNDLDPDFAACIDGYRCGSGTLRINVALSELPRFTGAHPDCAKSGIIIAPSLKYIEQAYFDARTYGWARQPVVEMLIPSTVDDTLAPAGRHVASLFCQHFAPELPDGRSWDAEKAAAAESVYDAVDRYAPNFKRSILAASVLSPSDLERTFGLTGGDIFHGAMHLDQLYSARPVLGYGNYRTPIRGLYQCGSGTHPGGGVSGVPGHNAAREITRDLTRRLRRPTRPG